MGPKGRKASNSDCEEGYSDGGTPLDDRKASGRAAEQSGRGNNVHFIDAQTSFAVLQDGETLDQSVYQLHQKKRNLMIELPAGGNVFYQSWAEKLSQTEVFIRIPREPPEVSECQWLNLASSRIWRGSMASRCWSCVSPITGAWRPKAAPPRDRKAPKKRLRPAHEADDEEATGVTPETQDTDAEDDALAQESPSPRPMKGSNAVSPDAEAGPAPAKMKVETEPREQGLLPTIKPDPEGVKETPRSDGQGLQNWFVGHWQLMCRRGFLNHVVSAGPESGLLSGEASDAGKGSDKRSEANLGRQTPACSSSSSADRSKPGSRSADRCVDTLNPALESSKRKVKRRALAAASDSDLQLSSRSTSPATPNKQGDGYRSAAQRQRSSSMDVDPRSVTAGLSSNPSAPATASCGEFQGGKGKPGPGPAKRVCADIRRPASKRPLPKRSLPRSNACVVGLQVIDAALPKAPKPAAQALKTKTGVAKLKPEAVLPRQASKPEAHRARPAVQMVAALMETDPFELPTSF